jgi:hypothetical protein
MLVESRVAEQRYGAVREVLDGASVAEVAPPLRGVAAECACLAAPVCRGGRPGRFG